MYDFVNGWNNSYTFCLTFWSWLRLNLPGMALPTLTFTLFGAGKLHLATQCHFQEPFSVNVLCGVLGNADRATCF
jgi:hypothetical protein